MNDPLDSPEKVQRAAEMHDVPSVLTRSLEECRAVRLCCIDGSAKAALLRWCISEGSGFGPTTLVDRSHFNDTKLSIGTLLLLYLSDLARSYLQQGFAYSDVTSGSCVKTSLSKVVVNVPTLESQSTLGVFLA